MKKCYLPAAIALLMTSPVVFSQSDPIIVTPTRTAQTVDETLASVTVITREEIEEQQASSVQDLLSAVPGISIVNSGGAGKSSSVFIRGTNSGHVLVLIDGAKVGSATLGTTPFQHIPVEQIEYIEIVRGPRSSLYGSEAIGGVIQIFTRKGGGETTPYFSMGAGSDDTFSTSAGVSGGGENSWFSIGTSSLQTNGFNSCPNCSPIDPDDDGYSNKSASLRAGYRFDSGLDLEISLLQSNNETITDGWSADELESEQRVLGSILRYAPGENWQISLQTARSNDDSDSFLNGVYSSTFNTERTTTSLQNDFSIARRHLLTIGIDNQDDEIASDTTYTETSRNNKSVFIQYQGKVSTHDLQIAVRKDDNEQFGSENTGSIA
ncbi:MAG: TonB-dependent receptor plug domain-containing protein, partial [Gammaproteobacteria bacterium]|nr:TonB-dependent receptor plug domain-containing protein [Gammaproteobacteria bacterium]